MPPSSARRGKSARKLDLMDNKSDGDDPELVVTPSRKRRKVQQSSQNADIVEKQETTDVVQPSSAGRRRKERLSDVSQASASPEELADDVIRQFRASKSTLQVRIDHANEKHEVEYPSGKTAFAKISGSGWTFYVTDLVVRIGRPPDERIEDAGTTNELGPAHVESKEDISLVHIDLGPSKLVSRQHAEIRYEDGVWTISVMGRNGLKLDDEPLPRGETRVIGSGSVIEIAGTQMMFVTPNQQPAIHPRILAMFSGVQDDEDEGVGRFRAPRPPTQRTPGGAHSLATHGNGSRDQYNNHGSNRGGHAYEGHHTHAHDPSQHDGTGDVRSSATKSSAYGRGALLDSGEDVDYSLDSAKDIKPPHSYAQLIGMAILSNEEEKLTLSKIYDFIKERYAFYRFSGGGWQNSIRHNLSLNKCFEKVARRTDEPGKGMKWQIVPEHRGEFMKRSFMNPRGRSIWSTSSGPNSPLKDIPSSAFPESKSGDNPFTSSQARSVKTIKLGGSFIKTSSRSTSPIGAFPPSHMAETPDHPATFFRSLQGLASSPTAMRMAATPLPDVGRGRHFFPGLNEAASSRTPGGPALHGGRDMTDRFATPLFARHKPNLAPPSTAHVPSHYMPVSSPAPFWKFANEFVSSPVKGDVGSPIKGGVDVSLKKPGIGAGNARGAEIRERDGRASPEDAVPDEVEASSSSPGATDDRDAVESPSRQPATRGPATRRRTPAPKIKVSQAGSLRDATPAAVPLATTSAAAAGAVPHQFEQDDEEEEEPAIDLAKGFQPIGSFHRALNPAAIRGN